MNILNCHPRESCLTDYARLAAYLLLARSCAEADNHGLSAGFSLRG